jgi:antirestriction protein ArdC
MKARTKTDFTTLSQSQASKRAAKYLVKRFTDILKARKEGSPLIPYATRMSYMPSSAWHKDDYHFSGWNYFVMATSGYSNAGFLTYKQAEDLGGHVRSGEKGIPTFFAKTDNRLDDQTGETKQVFIYKSFTHFNVEQCVGLPKEVVERFASKDEVNRAQCIDNALIEDFLTKTGAKIKYNMTTRIAGYSPASDTIVSPTKKSYPTDEYRYSVLMHELGHWTGHKTRLNRYNEHSFNPHSAQYAKEELMAELFAMAMGNHFGIGLAPITEMVTITKNSDAYIAYWLERLGREDSLHVQQLMKATHAAYKAMLFVQEITGAMNIVPQPKTKPVKTQEVVAA